jgi:two-component system cell cycle response regulator DivK
MAHVLLIEDNKMNAQVVELMLKRRGGFDVTTTEDAYRALELARGGTIDLVILDVSLPNSVLSGKPINGLQISRLLKGDPLTARLPVILLTAHALRGDRESFLAASLADQYISKPITDSQGLIEEVARLVGSGKPRPAGPPGRPAGAQPASL